MLDVQLQDIARLWIDTTNALSLIFNQIDSIDSSSEESIDTNINNSSMIDNMNLYETSDFDVEEVLIDLNVFVLNPETSLSQ